MRIISKIELLLIGIWLGAACFFSFAVAPSAFGVLPSRELAGSVVNRTLMIINISGLVIGVILLAASFIPRGETKKIWVWLQRVLLFVLCAACAVGQFVIALYLTYIRSQFGGQTIDKLAVDDPLKIQFNFWHQYSVWVLVTGMIAALLVFFIISRKHIAAEKIGKDVVEIPDFELPDDLKM